MPEKVAQLVRNGAIKRFPRSASKLTTEATKKKNEVSQVRLRKPPLAESPSNKAIG